MISLFKNDLKQLKNVVVIFSSLMLLCLVINLVSYRPEVPVTVFYVISLIYCLVVPLVNLKYLFDQTKQTHFASLPFTKGQSFIIHYLSGLFCILLPLLVYCLVDAMLGQGIIVANCPALFLMVWIYYSFGNLTAYLTRSIIVDLVLETVIIMAPVIMYICLWLVYQTFVRGIVGTDLSYRTISILMPLVNLIVCSSETIAPSYIYLYLGYGLVFFGLALYACKSRGLEKNYHGYTNNIVGQTIKILVIISLSWVITSVFDLRDQTLKSFMMVNIMATFIVTFVIQFIYSKKIRYVLCVLQATVIALMTIGLVISTRGYLENYIPSNIDAVSIKVDNYGETPKKYRLTDQKIIDQIVHLHQDFIDQKNDTGGNSFLITYYKSNGEKTMRNYYVNNQHAKEMYEQFKPEMVKCWYSSYYDILDEIDECDYGSYGTYQDDHQSSFDLKDESDILLFKNILKQKLDLFYHQPSLIQNVENEAEGQFTLMYNQKYDPGTFGTTVEFNKNDPLFLAIEEYHKIKAN